MEPEIPICDPHHHFWDFRSERIPYQRYLLHELAADVNCGHNVRSTVFIEARRRLCRRQLDARQLGTGLVDLFTTRRNEPAGLLHERKLS